MIIVTKLFKVKCDFCDKDIGLKVHFHKYFRVRAAGQLWEVEVGGNIQELDNQLACEACYIKYQVFEKSLEEKIEANKKAFLIQKQDNFQKTE